MDNDTCVAWMRDAKQHFFRLKTVVNELLPSIGIPIRKVLLEPTFFSERYGIQGRLDLFFGKVRKQKSLN